jgi:NitT/TauT family transport system substrate-binding protein
MLRCATVMMMREFHDGATGVSMIDSVFFARSKLGQLLLACSLLVPLLIAASPSQAQTKPLKKARLMVATGVLDVTYTEFTLPTILGYWKDEGYDVDVQPAGGSLQGFQQVIGGGADLAAGSGSAIVGAVATANLPLRVAMTMRNTDWAVAVDKKGPIQSAKDLKGKTIGVFNMATGGLPWLNALLRRNGYDPSKDIELVATAMGATPVQAMQAGRVQGLLYWGSAIASFENAGLEVREIVGDDWRAYPDYSIGVTQATLDKDPAMVIAVTRGIAKAMTFLNANPSCAIKLHWAAFPATKVTGVDDVALMKRDLHSVNRSIRSNQEATEMFGGGTQIGAYDTAAWGKLIDFMVETKQIEKRVAPEMLGANIPELYTKMNDFDHRAVQESAKACKV